MVGIVVVSHSPDLAHAAVSLALQMVHGSAPRIEIAAGTSDYRLGTDAARVAEAIVGADDGKGVVVIMDLGSAVLSAELAIELLPEPRIPTRLVPAAFVEGITAAAASTPSASIAGARHRPGYRATSARIGPLRGRATPGLPDPGHPYVLVAVDLAPADAAGLDATACLAIVTEEGGPTAHAAIIARSLGIPAVVGVPGASAVPDGTLLLVDGTTGELIIEPTIDQQASATARQQHRDVLTGPGRRAMATEQVSAYRGVLDSVRRLAAWWCARWMPARTRRSRS